MQDIKPLLVFAAVLEHGSMNAAAAVLGMTPSAVSQHINRLETLHGIKLLNRSTRSLAPPMPAAPWANTAVVSPPCLPIRVPLSTI